MITIGSQAHQEGFLFYNDLNIYIMAFSKKKKKGGKQKSLLEEDDEHNTFILVKFCIGTTIKPTFSPKWQGPRGGNIYVNLPVWMSIGTHPQTHVRCII